MKDLIFHPVISTPWLIFWVIGTAALVGWSLRRGIRSRLRMTLLGTFRAAALIALLVMLTQPQRRHDEVTVLRPQLAVLIDKSESMTDPVDRAQPNRSARVAEWLKTPAIARAKRDFDFRLFAFDQGLTELNPQSTDTTPTTPAIKYDGVTSNVIESARLLQEHFRGQPLAGVLMLSDGLDTAGGSTPGNKPKPETSDRPATEAAPESAPKTPIFTFELEKPFTPRRPPKKVSLANIDYPPRVVTGWDTELRVNVAGRGMSGQTVNVELWRDGIKTSESPLAFNEDDQTRQVAFPVSHATTGTFHYELRIPDPAADKEARAYPFVIEVMDPGNRVLYLQNSLGFDFKFLRKAIVTDRNLQLSAFVRWAGGQLVSIADAGAQNPKATLDFSPQALANNAVVILGDLPPDALTPANGKALRDFVDRGGGLVLLGGPNSLASPGLAKSQLAPLLPVRTPADYREGSFPMEITDTGLHHPVFGSLFTAVKDFPPLLTCNVAANVAPTAEVLMETVVGGKRCPVIAAMRFGKGRVIVILSDTIWRWRLASKGWAAERSPYDTFWAQMMDWLIPKEQSKQNSNRLELFTTRANYLMGEHPQICAILRTLSPDAKQPASLPLEIRTPDDKVFQYTLHPGTLQTNRGNQVSGYRVEVEPNVAGVFRAKSSTTIAGTTIEGETRFVVSQRGGEITGKPVDRQLLTRIAESSGGRFYRLSQWENWRGDLHVHEQHFSRVELLDLWNNPYLLGFLLVMLAADWTTRKFWNLP